MVYRIKHVTRYDYHEPVGSCYNESRLQPRSLPWQHCLATSIRVKPEPTAMSERTDFFGNHVCFFSVLTSHTCLTVRADSKVQIESRPLVDSLHSVSWEKSRETLRSGRETDIINARQFTLESPMVRTFPGLVEYAAPSFTANRCLIESVADLTTRIYTDFSFDPKFTTVSTPIEEVLDHRRGVCQDFAHLAIGCMRAMGLPARYMSGYIETVPPPGEERLVGADVSHAWFAIYHPEAGWIDFDPTNNQICGNRHITVAFGRDYSDVPPLKGIIYGGGKHKLTVTVDVEPIS